MQIIFIYVIITSSLNVRSIIIHDTSKISMSIITQQLKSSKTLNLTHQNFFKYKNLLSNNSHKIYLIKIYYKFIFHLTGY